VSQRRLAILVGSGKYPDEEKLQDLRCPARDVDGLAEVLQSPKHGAFSETVVVKDRPHHEVLLKINRLLKSADKNDFVVIYYSGHGKLDAANRLHLCTTNTVIDALEATSVPVQSIKNYIDIAPPRQVSLVLDCCFSGAVGDVFARSGVDDQLQQMSGGRGTYIMSASTAVQVAIEKEEDEHSIFTKRLIEGISTGKADVDSDGLITMDELYKYVHDNVLDDGFQEPMKWSINVRGDLIIARTAKPPRGERRKKVRERLLELAGADVLPDTILSSAMDLLGKDAALLSSELKSLDSLLDRLGEEKIAVGEFVGEWYAIELKHRRRSGQTEPPGRVSGGAGIAPVVPPPKPVKKKEKKRRVAVRATPPGRAQVEAIPEIGETPTGLAAQFLRIVATRAGLTVLLAVLFVVNWVETAVEARLNILGALTEQNTYAIQWVERYLSFEGHDLTNMFAVYGYSISYFFLFPILLIGVAMALARRPQIAPYRVLTFAMVINYLISLPFFLLFPVPERWAYPDSGAMLLADKWTTGLIEMIRPISGLDNCFPSSHTSMTVIVILLCFHFRTRLRWSILPLGLTVILSTLILGIHWLPDVVAGTAVGIVSVHLALRLEQRVSRQTAQQVTDYAYA